MSDTALDVMAALAAEADPARIPGLSRFFKTAPGQYGEGDQFLGMTVPTTRRVVRPYVGLGLDQVDILLDSAVHEHRFVGLLILVAQYPKNSQEIADFQIVKSVSRATRRAMRTRRRRGAPDADFRG